MRHCRIYQLSTSLWLTSMDTIWSISIPFHEGTQRGVPTSNLGYTYNCIHINHKKILLMENTFGHDPKNTRENILLICILVFFFANQIDVGYELIKKMIDDIYSENSHTCFICKLLWSHVTFRSKANMHHILIVHGPKANATKIYLNCKALQELQKCME